MRPVLILRPPHPYGLVLPGLLCLLPGGQGLGREACPAPQPLETGGAPDTEFSLLVWDTDDRGGEVRGAACYLEQPRADLFSLQAGAQDLARFVEAEQGVQAALQTLRGTLALRYIVDDHAQRLAAAVGDHTRTHFDVEERTVLPAVA